jgi:hypothetical protein
VLEQCRYCPQSALQRAKYVVSSSVLSVFA